MVEVVKDLLANVGVDIVKTKELKTDKFCIFDAAAGHDVCLDLETLKAIKASQGQGTNGGSSGGSQSGGSTGGATGGTTGGTTGGGTTFDPTTCPAMNPAQQVNVAGTACESIPTGGTPTPPPAPAPPPAPVPPPPAPPTPPAFDPASCSALTPPQVVNSAGTACE